jgi:hypothetical protein
LRKLLRNAEEYLAGLLLAAVTLLIVLELILQARLGRGEDAAFCNRDYFGLMRLKGSPKRLACGR